MRTLIVAVVLAVPSVVHAESFFEGLFGISIPVGDSDWTNRAESSPKLEARAGAMGDNGIGGMLQADWTPVNLDQKGFNGFGTNFDVSGQRYRILADLAFHKRVAPKLIANGRIGAGIDIAHTSVTITSPLGNGSSSDTDTNFAFELGGGLYYDVGSVQIGGELALPIGHHSKQGNPTAGSFTFNYTSYDIDILFGERFTSR